MGGAPCVVLSIRDGVSSERVAELVAGGVSIVEVRIDEFSKVEEGYVVEELRKLGDYPVLGTIRMQKEGGGWRGTEEERLALFHAILPHVDAVDIGSPLEPQLRLYDSSFNEIASDEPAGFTDPLITYTFSSTGIYYIEVASDLILLNDSGPYMLNITL